MYKNTIRIALIFVEKLIFTVCFTDSPQTGSKKTDDYGYTTVLYRRGEKTVFLQVQAIITPSILFPEKEDLSKMKELMKRVVALDCYGRDKNGINGLLRNIDTALISTVEIGLKRTSVIALLLYRPVMKRSSL